MSGEIFNISSGTHQSILSIAEKFEAPIEFIPERSGEARVSWGSNEKFVQRTGWKPSLSVDEYISNSLG